MIRHLVDRRVVVLGKQSCIKTIANETNFALNLKNNCRLHCFFAAVFALYIQPWFINVQIVKCKNYSNGKDKQTRRLTTDQQKHLACSY